MKTIFARFPAALLPAILLALSPGALRAQTGAAGAAAAATTPRFAMLDMKRTMDNYYKRTQMQAAFEEYQSTIKKDLADQYKDAQAGLDSLNKMAEEINDPSITTEEREKRRAKAQQKANEVKNAKENFDNAQARANQSLQMKMEQMISVLTKDIRTAVKDIASRGGYAFVVDSSAENLKFNTPVLLYTNGENDITEQVLKQLNAAAPPETTKTADKPEEKKQKP